MRGIFRFLQILLMVVVSDSFLHGTLLHFKSTRLSRATGRLSYRPRMGMFDWLTGRDKDVEQEISPQSVQVVSPSSMTFIPASYDQIHDQAISCVAAGLKRGLNRMEVCVSPLQSFKHETQNSSTDLTIGHR